MGRTLGTIAILATCAGVAAAQSIRKPDAAVHRHETGLGLRLPAGWSAQDDEQGIVLVPPGGRFDASQPELSELYLAVSQTGYDAAEESQFVGQLSAGFLRRGAQLSRSGERENIGTAARTASAYAWEMTDPATGKPFALKLYLAPTGARAFVVVAMGETQLVRSRDAALRDIVSSMDFASPKIAAGAPLADNTPAAQAWLAKLRGKLIKRFIGGGGAAGQKLLTLTADGRYTFQSSVAIAADVGRYGGAPTASATATGRNSQTGKWRIVDKSGRTFLQLIADNGDVQTLALTSDNRNWYLNGEKAFAVEP